MGFRGTVAIFVCLELAGCSLFLAASPVADEQPTAHLSCGGRTVPPALDSMGAVFSLGGGLLALAGSSQASGESAAVGRGVGLLIGIPLVGAGLLYVIAASYGYSQHRQCVEHNRDIDEVTLRARDPDAGRAGHFCRAGSRLWTCQPGLRCLFDRCINDSSQAGVASIACRPFPGMPNTFACGDGQHCVEGHCVFMEGQ